MDVDAVDRLLIVDKKCGADSQMDECVFILEAKNMKRHFMFLSKLYDLEGHFPILKSSMNYRSNI